MSGDSQPPSLKDFSERLRAARENQEDAREIRGPSRQYGLAFFFVSKFPHVCMLNRSVWGQSTPRAMVPVGVRQQSDAHPV